MFLVVYGSFAQAADALELLDSNVSNMCLADDSSADSLHGAALAGAAVLVPSLMLLIQCRCSRTVSWLGSRISCGGYPDNKEDAHAARRKQLLKAQVQRVGNRRVALRIKK